MELLGTMSFSSSFPLPPLVYPSHAAGSPTTTAVATSHEGGIRALTLPTSQSDRRSQCRCLSRCQFGCWSSGLAGVGAQKSPRNCRSIGGGGDNYESQETVEEIRIPDHWLLPSKALEESEWLRAALGKWLDDEYCPEPTNVEISKVAARSYHNSLLQRTTDVNEILLSLITELQSSISYQESFHGAFSSANAAVSLIIERIQHHQDDG